jgi:hypothetical protein
MSESPPGGFTPSPSGIIINIYSNTAFILSISTL